MWQELYKQLKTAILVFLLLSLISGIIYPFIITITGQTFFPYKANGSFIKHKNIIIGSKLIGQYFNSSKYFWGRPSATQPLPYNPQSSSASNLAPTNPELIKQIKARIKILTEADKNNKNPIPIDLVTASGSGLDPEISPTAAYYQIHRVATARGVSDNIIKQIVTKHITNRQFGCLGEPRVNVLMLNLALDEEIL